MPARGEKRTAHLQVKRILRNKSVPFILTEEIFHRVLAGIAHHGPLVSLRIMCRTTPRQRAIKAVHHTEYHVCGSMPLTITFVRHPNLALKWTLAHVISAKQRSEFSGLACSRPRLLQTRTLRSCANDRNGDTADMTARGARHWEERLLMKVN